jgi:hypothetical protein
MGGMTLFLRGFGNYDQAIVLRLFFVWSPGQAGREVRKVR